MAIDYLESGYKRFRTKYFEDENNQAFKHLKTGQSPKTLVIACSDSRVDPALLMDCAPGDLFVVRNVANLVPPFEDAKESYHGTSAALEFGTCGLQVENILILGHSMCGGITSLFQKDQNIENRDFVNKWMEITGNITNHKSIDPNEELGIKADKCSRLGIKKSLDNLLTFPFINERVQSNKLQLHGWYFDIRTGKIEAFDKESDSFKELS